MVDLRQTHSSLNRILFSAIAVIGIAVVLLVLLGFFSKKTDVADRYPAIMAHRGLNEAAPENTLAAFAAAVELKFDVEFDVYECQSKELVVIHDLTVDRTSNGSGAIADMSLDEIKSLDAGSWYESAFVDEEIPMLSEVFACIRERQSRETTIAVNLKTISPGIEEKIVRQAEEAGMLSQILCFGMDEEANRRLKQANPLVKTAMATTRFRGINLEDKEDWHRAIHRGDVDAFWVNFVPDVDEILAAQKAGKTVWFHFRKSHPAKAALRATQNGVDGICTDFPIELRRVLSASRHESSEIDTQP
ncbi:MAG: hypothetical protein CMJ77_22590 [Planctomycetaceae bacterium]|nr:hypothetical protein [Planctomycetaceae bacterium]